MVTYGNGDDIMIGVRDRCLNVYRTNVIVITHKTMRNPMAAIVIMGD